MVALPPLAIVPSEQFTVVPSKLKTHDASGVTEIGMIPGGVAAVNDTLVAELGPVLAMVAVKVTLPPGPSPVGGETTMLTERSAVGCAAGRRTGPASASMARITRSPGVAEDFCISPPFE
jgi:hypothetical protein